MQYEHQPQKTSTTIEESQSMKRKSKKSWLRKQVTKRKGVIPLESPLGIALSKEEVAKSSQEVTPSKSLKKKSKSKKPSIPKSPKEKVLRSGTVKLMKQGKKLLDKQKWKNSPPPLDSVRKISKHPPLSNSLKKP